MRLTSLHVRRLPGIDVEYVLQPGPGVNLLLGPNASGKSSTARAVRDLLWPMKRATDIAWLKAVFSDGGTEWTVTSDGPTTTWRRNGEPAPGPVLPPARLADCYRLSAPDLLGAHGEFDRDLAKAIRAEMTGGYDLDDLQARLARPSRRAAKPFSQALQTAREEVAKVERAQEELADRRDGEADLEARATAAEAAGRRLTALETRRDHDDARLARDKAAAVVAAFPEVMCAVRPDDSDHLARLNVALADRSERDREIAAEIADLDARLTDLALPGEGNAEARVDRIASLADASREAAHARDVASERRGALARLREAARGADLDGEGDALDRLHQILAAADAGLDAFAGELAAPAAAQPPGRRAVALVLLVGGALAAVAGALPFTPSVASRIVLAVTGGGLALAGAFMLAAWSHAQALHLKREELARRVEAATRGSDELATQADALAQAEAAVAGARNRLEAELAALGEELAPWGLSAPVTAAAAVAAREDLQGRMRRSAELDERLGRARQDRDRAAREAQDARTQAAHLLRRLELPPDLAVTDPVRDLVDRHPDWLAATGALRDAEATLLRLGGEVDRQSAAAGLTVPGDADLETLIAEAESEAAEAPYLREELGSLRQELRTADAGQALAAALVREEETREELGAWCDKARDELAEAALLEELRRQHEGFAAPPRLREANRLLDDFTQGRHSLVLAAGGTGTGFMAKDARTEDPLQLDQLSDGTRAQVLLAVRVAFVAGIETGTAPPLFLDESLTTSDPQRLAAVAGSLGRLADTTGRQIFYLTSQPGDVAAWRGALADAGLPAPTVLDLAAARREGCSAAPEQLAPAAGAEVPAPDWRDPVAYGLLLGVTGLDPHRSWRETDTFHLAAPDLDLVRRLRAAGLKAAGTLAAALPRLEHVGVAEPEQRARLAGAIDVLRAFTAAWRIGRPRPATIEDVDGSGAVTEVFRPKVLALLAEHGWHAARFMEAAAAGGLPRFQSRKLEALREHLEEADCLDERTPLDRDALVTEVLLRAATGPQEEARTSPEEVRALVLRLLAAIPPAIAADSATRPSGSGPTG